MSETVIWIAVSVVAGLGILAVGYVIGFRHGFAWAKNPESDEIERKRPSAC